MTIIFIKPVREVLVQVFGINSLVIFFTACVRLVKENLNWGTKSELKAEVLRGIKEIGSVLYWMGLLDIVLVCNLIHLIIYRNLVINTKQCYSN